ncbi:hypothetical protein SDC9_207175 [bioreactor metagenome]|uniref:Uncharacterized protein n=1 Tax=bioreactor metagenome TaxID=1076179 RepID=A0A645JGH3_9ZZZZ
MCNPFRVQGNLLVQPRQGALTIRGMQQLGPAFEAHRNAAIDMTEHFITARIPVQRTGTHVPLPQAVLHRPDGQAQALLAARQRFRSQALGSHIMQIAVPQG